MQDKQYQQLTPEARMNLFRQAFDEQCRPGEEGANHHVGTRISRTFDRMTIAEGAIQQILNKVVRRLKQTPDAMKQQPEYKRVWGAFAVLCPPECMADKCDKVYRAHCLELVQRVRDQVDTRLGTDAECLCALLDHSLKEPLNSTACAAAEKLFATVFAPVGAEFAKAWARERWDGAADQLIAELRAKCGDAKRVLSDPEGRDL